MGGRVFAVAQQTIDAFPLLQSFFEQSGELLPFLHEGRDFLVFSCTNCINALNQEKTEYRTGRTSIKKYSFIPTRFHFTLFTVPESNELFCVEGMSAPHDEFKGYVEEQKLKGVLFEEVWREGKEDLRVS